MLIVITADKAAGGRFVRAVGGIPSAEATVFCKRLPHTNCVDNDSRSAELWHCPSGFRRSRIPLGERTISNGNTTAPPGW
ncbi:MAG: hypothetical protein IKA09_12890 [Lachnospiraceae bacterium]|nr:hypothetical protein [Lachnospiraceae bacterium]